MNRRKFLQSSALVSTALASPSFVASATHSLSSTPSSGKPIVISTWTHGMAANIEAWKTLETGGYALDAIEAGVRRAEDNPLVRTVGLGGHPDRDGHVTLDACIQNEKSDCGSVMFLEGIQNPISVARMVMENTPHAVLAGAGAKQFALDQGFVGSNLLTEISKKEWQQWREEAKYKPEINIENHDTIAMLAMDAEGRLCGACTTSGTAYKLHGRVGDSPIIGAGLFVDNEVGGACATGLGEAIIRTAGSAITVEMMRHGATPMEACKEAVERIARKHPKTENLQVGFLAMNMKGEVGAYGLKEGFNYACTYEGYHELLNAQFISK